MWWETWRGWIIILLYWDDLASSKIYFALVIASSALLNCFLGENIEDRQWISYPFLIKYFMADKMIYNDVLFYIGELCLSDIFCFTLHS